MNDFDFNDLFVFDMANNHQGDINHGLAIIRGIGDTARKNKIRAAFKFQFRQLDTFVHRDYRNSQDNKHIQRFLSTRLDKKEFAILIEEVRRQNMLTMATPFDEESVDFILDNNIEIIKVASCSATDRPLLEYIAKVNLPVIISTAGLSVNHIDRLVSFFEHKRVKFALMYCVALYPTPDDRLHLNQIKVFKNRYPKVPIGFSTHEYPRNLAAVKIAYANGARIFERHVGIANKKYKLNEYSSTPAQINQWLKAYAQTVEMCGGDGDAPGYPEEINSLRSLMRGVFAARSIKKGCKISRDEVFFAMPLLSGQLTSGEWRDWFIADKNYRAREPLSVNLANYKVPRSELVYQIMLQVKGMLNNAGIFIGKDSSVEISHHYGIERFREYGCAIISCINRTYCKKLIIQLPRQKHPYHYHKKKEETFQLLYGDLESDVEGKRVTLKAGDTVLVRPNQWHKFHTLDGAIFEEISTTHYNDDSFYEDERISRIPREKRKTVIANWEVAITE